MRIRRKRSNSQQPHYTRTENPASAQDRVFESVALSREDALAYSCTETAAQQEAWNALSRRFARRNTVTTSSYSLHTVSWVPAGRDMPAQRTLPTPPRLPSLSSDLFCRSAALFCLGFSHRFAAIENSQPNDRSDPVGAVDVWLDQSSDQSYCSWRSPISKIASVMRS